MKNSVLVSEYCISFDTDTCDVATQTADFSLKIKNNESSAGVCRWRTDKLQHNTEDCDGYPTPLHCWLLTAATSEAMTGGMMEFKDFFFSSSNRSRHNVGWPHVCLADALLVFRCIPVTLCSWQIPRWQTCVSQSGIKDKFWLWCFHTSTVN